MRIFSFVCLLFVACHTGSFDEECNKDGTCNGEHLYCDPSWKKCRAKEPPRPPEPPRRCYYESECFCVTCADKCGDAGVKHCAYSDTSVWGSKPAVCECK